MKQIFTKKTIYLFCGEDTYSSNKKIKFWKNEFIKKYGDESNIEIIDGKNMDTTRFSTNLETVPFLSDKRLLIVKDFLTAGSKDDQKKIAESLIKTPDFCIVVFHENNSPNKTGSLFKKIKQIGTIEEFNHLTPAQLTKWILKKAGKENINISQPTAHHLSLHCGLELWRISNELQKLKLYSNGNEITSQIIDELVVPSLSASIFKLTDAIAGKNPKQSLKTLQILKDSGEELTKIFFMIVRHFRILIQVHDMIQKDERQSTIIKKLKQHPFVIQKTSNQSKNFTPEKLEEIYSKFLQIDKKLKTGIIKIYQGDDREYKLAIEKLIIDCCR
ncbi:DNA polymerase III subunit delta [Candidatus Peregrinibacteria bacterium]|nr:DNA polymerase III subunit delta [Candidatus Peregrinibacteria bacterium]